MLFVAGRPVKVGFLAAGHVWLAGHRVPVDFRIVDQQGFEEAFGRVVGRALDGITVAEAVLGVHYDLPMRVIGLMSDGSTFGFRSYVARPFCSCSTSVSCV